MIKVPVASNENGVAYLQVESNAVYFHCDIYKWNKSTYKEFKEIFRIILARYRVHTDKPLLAPVTPNDAKHKKFVGMFGFEPTGRQGIDSGGNVIDVYSIGEDNGT